MCGICGFIQTNIANTPQKWDQAGRPLLTKLFDLISTRGTDASGFGMLKNDVLSVVKHHVSSPDMIKKALYQTKLDQPPEIFIGHSRAATQGSPNRNINNHPFVSQDRRYVLVHNGMLLHGQYKIEKELNISLKGNCDSEVYLRIIEKLGIYEGVNYICRSLKYSMFALLIIDTESKVLHFVRDTSAPIAVLDLFEEAGGAFLVSTKQIFWNSLLTVLTAGLTWKLIKAVVEPNPYTLYSWPINVPKPYSFFGDQATKLIEKETEDD